MKLIQLVSNQDGELTYALDDQGQLHSWGKVKEAFGRPVYGFRPEVNNRGYYGANAVLNALAAAAKNYAPDHPKGSGAKAKLIHAVCEANGWDRQLINSGYVLTSAEEKVHIFYTKDVNVIKIHDHHTTYYLDLVKRAAVNEPA